MQNPKVKCIQVPARELEIHPRAQRDLVPSRLKRIRENLDLDAIGTVHAVELEVKGKKRLFVVDGQHRVTVLNEPEIDCGDWLVNAMVHLDVHDDKGACALFLKLNDRSPICSFDKYTNELRAGIPEAMGVSRVIKECGLTVARYKADGTIVAPMTLKKVYCLDAGKSLSLGLRIIMKAWGNEKAALEGKLVEGVALVMNSYAGVIDTDALISMMSKFGGGPGAVLGRAKSQDPHQKEKLGVRVGQVILDAYNKCRRSGKLDPL